MFEKTTETVERDKWVWTDPDVFGVSGPAYNGKTGPIIVAAITLLAIALIALTI